MAKEYTWENGVKVGEHDLPAAAIAPLVLDGADWREYAYGVLGSGNAATGLARYGAILKGARASTDDSVVAALDQYANATNFRKEKVAIFLQVLVADGEIVTPTEYAAILASWPEA